MIVLKNMILVGMNVKVIQLYIEISVIINSIKKRKRAQYYIKVFSSIAQQKKYEKGESKIQLDEIYKKNQGMIPKFVMENLNLSVEVKALSWYFFIIFQFKND